MESTSGYSQERGINSYLHAMFFIATDACNTWAKAIFSIIFWQYRCGIRLINLVGYAAARFACQLAGSH